MSKLEIIATILLVGMAGLLIYGITEIINNSSKQKEIPCSELGDYKTWQLPARCLSYYKVK